MIDIRQGSANDVAAIMPVMDDAFDPDFGEAWTSAQCLSSLALPCSQLLLARNLAGVHGFTLSRWVADEEELLLIGVAPNARRQNIGRQLIETLVENARGGNRASVFLEVREGNPAHDFYRKIGFQPYGRRKGYYRSKDGLLFDSITMALRI